MEVSNVMRAVGSLHEIIQTNIAACSQMQDRLYKLSACVERLADRQDVFKVMQDEGEIGRLLEELANIGGEFVHPSVWTDSDLEDGAGAILRYVILRLQETGRGLLPDNTQNVQIEEVPHSEET